MSGNYTGPQIFGLCVYSAHRPRTGPIIRIIVGIITLFIIFGVIGFGLAPEKSIPLICAAGALGTQKFINSSTPVRLRYCSSIEAKHITVLGAVYWVYISLFAGAFLFSLLYILYKIFFT